MPSLFFVLLPSLLFSILFDVQNLHSMNYSQSTSSARLSLTHLHLNSRIKPRADRRPNHRASLQQLILLFPSPSLTPNIFLINPTTPHPLHGLLRLRLVHPSLLGNNLRQHLIDLPCHVARVTADVEIALLLQEIVDQFAIFAEEVLHVDFRGAFTREGVENG